MFLQSKNRHRSARSVLGLDATKILWRLEKVGNLNGQNMGSSIFQETVGVLVVLCFVMALWSCECGIVFLFSLLKDFFLLLLDFYSKCLLHLFNGVFSFPAT